MKAKNNKINLSDKNNDNKSLDDPKNAPWYPANEDIYVKDKEEKEIDPEDISRKKPKNEAPDQENEEDFFDDETGEDLDVPGSELDDDEEDIGNEDEENNYYSIGGDNHNDLEEDN